MNLQHVGDNSQRPHVCSKGDWFKIDDFRGTELRSTKEDLDILALLQSLGQTKVNDLDILALLGDTHHILRLKTLVLKSLYHTELLMIQ